MYFFQFLGVGWDWNHLARRPLFGLLYQAWMTDDDDDECGALGGMRIGRGDRSSRRKPAPVPLCPPQIQHDLTWARTRGAAVGSRRLKAWAMAWHSPLLPPLLLLLLSLSLHLIINLLFPHYHHILSSCSFNVLTLRTVLSGSETSLVTVGSVLFVLHGTVLSQPKKHLDWPLVTAISERWSKRYLH
jgi:hypothetical protein